jgi:hypothetical protein
MARVSKRPISRLARPIDSRYRARMTERNPYANSRAPRVMNRMGMSRFVFYFST